MENASILLHPAQRDILTDQLIDTTSSQYNIGGYIKLKGSLNTEKFHAAVNSGPQIFDVFKMRFDLESEDNQYYFDQNYEMLEMADHDFSKQTNPEEAARAWMQQQFNTAFDLKPGGLLFEQCLLKISNNEHWFFGKFHHLITDGYDFIVWVPVS